MSDTINTIVDKKAQEQVLLLVKNLELADSAFLKLIEDAEKFGKSKPFPSPKTPKDYNKSIKESSTFLTKAKAAAEAAAKANNGLVKAQAQYNESSSHASKETAKLKVEMQQANAQAKNLAKISSSLSTEYEKQSAKLNLLRKTQKHYNTIVELGGKLSKKQQGELKRTTAEVQRLDAALKRVDTAAGQFNRVVGNYPKGFKAAGNAIRNLASAAGLLGGAFLAVQVARSAANSIISFDRSMQNLSGILRTNRADLEDLQTEIIEVAGASVNSATEVAKLAEALVTMGKSKNEVKSLLAPVNDLAIGLEAVGADAGEFLIQTMNAFGASTDEAAIYADQIATIRTSTSLNFQKMRDSFSYLAPISKLLNKDLAHTGSVIGILADNGLKAESAGRLLATAQQTLAKDGIPLSQGLEMINKAIREGKNELEVLAVASGIFGKQAGKVGAILAANTEQIDINAQAIRENTGALNDLVKEQLKSLGAALSILKSRWEEYVINSNLASGASEFFSKIINFLADNLENIIGTITKTAIVFAVYKTAVMVSSIQTAIFTKRTVAARIATHLMSGSVSGLRKAMILLNRTMKVSPWGIAAAAIAVAVIAYNKFSKKVTRTANDIRKTTVNFIAQRKETQALADKTRSLMEEYDNLKSITNKTEAEQNRLNTVIKLLAKNVPNAVSKFDDYARAIGISKEKVQEFLKANKDLISQGTEARLKEETELLKKQEAAQKKVNEVTREGGIASIEGVGEVIRVNSKYLKQTKEIGLYGIERQKREALNSTEIDTLGAIIKKRNEEVLATKDRIAKLKGEETMAEKFKKIADQDVEDQKENTKIIVRTRKEIAIAEKELFEIRKKGDDINEKEGERAIELDKMIAGKKKLIKEILGENKATKDSKKKRKEEKSVINELIKSYDELEMKVLKSFLNAESTEGKKKYLKELIDIREQLEELKGGEDDIILGNIAIGEVDTSGLSDAFEAIKIAQEEFPEIKIKLSTEEGLNAARDYFSEIGNLTSTLSDARIQKIDDEINKNNDFYANALDNENLTTKKREQLEAERDAKNAEFEKKKRDEAIKTAKLERALSIAQITIQTALAITKVLDKPFLIPLVAGLGALQLAVAIATPIPEYKTGKKVGQGADSETAVVGDGYRHEVIKGADGSIRLTPSVPTLATIKKSDEIFPSIDAALKAMPEIDFNSQIIKSSMIPTSSAQNTSQDLESILNKMASQGSVNAKNIEKAVSRAMRNTSINNNLTLKNSNNLASKTKHF